ncbi:MAG: hypothetical protein ACFB0Z_01295 [Candidatus Phaeomarinobacter sp.]
MSTTFKQDTQLPELLPTPLGTKIAVAVGAVVMAAYVVALVAEAANIL